METSLNASGFTQNSDDLTQAKLQFAENQNRWLEEMLNRLPKPFFLFDPRAKKVTFSNKAAADILGVTYAHTHPTEAYFGKLISARHPDGREMQAHETATTRTMNGEELKGDEYVIKSPAGNFHLRAFSSQLPAMYGQPASAILLLQDITTLKQTEKALQQTESELNQAIQVAQIGFWHLELPSYKLKVSPLLMKHFGLTDSTFHGTLDEAVSAIHPEDRERVSIGIDQAINHKAPFHMEYRVIHPDQNILWVEARGEVTYENGKAVSFIGTTLNVTERTLARQRIEQSAREFIDLADSMPQIVWTARPDGMLDYFNKVWFDYSGTTYADNVGDGWAKAVHPADLTPTAERWKKSVLSGNDYENEFRLFSKNTNSYRWFVARAHAVRDENGQIRKWYGTNTDIHDNKTLSNQLQVTKDRLELAMEGAGIGTWYLEIENNKITSSQNAGALVGMTELDMSVTELIERAMHPDDRDHVQRVLREALEKRSDYFDEFRIVKPDGSIRWLRSSGRGRYNPDGTSPSHLAGIVFDVTNEKVRTEQIEEDKRIAEAANAAKSQFLANMSHEIRTPLGAIMGFVSLLRDETLTRQDQEGFLSVIDRNSNQLLRIIDDILDLSKVEAGMMMIEGIRFSVPELLADFSSLMGFKAREKGIGFFSKAITPLPKIINSDPTRLRQILMNVVGNAIKFTDRGHVELNISYKNGCLEFLIQDTGRGITPEQEKNLFQPFSQADTSITRKYGGTGLGLVLTRRLSEALGGSFTLENSKLAEGSTFKVIIKAPTDPQVEFVTGLGFQSEPVRSIVSLGQLSGTKILLVEDSPDNQALISIFLNRAGASIDVASDGAQGCHMALSQSYDIILMDVQMPIMDGITAVKQLRAGGYKKPIIALTAHAMKEERIRCLEAGFDNFLSKPIIREQLISTLVSYRS